MTQGPLQLCTVCTRATLADAVVLGRSWQRVAGADARVLVVVADEDRTPPPAAGLEVVAAHALGIRAFDVLAGAYDAELLPAALIPFALRRLTGPGVHLPPGAVALAPLELPGDRDAALAPRGTGRPPALDPTFAAILGDGGPLLRWWEDGVRTLAWTPEQLDGAVGTVPGVAVLEQPGAAITPENARVRGVHRDAEGTLAAEGGARVQWIRTSDIPAPGGEVALAEALAERAAAVVACAEELPPPADGGASAWARTVDGTPMDDRLRGLLRDGVREGLVHRGPYDVGGATAFFAFLRDADPDPAMGGIPRLVAAAYREHPVLPDTYPDPRDPAVRAELLGWMWAHGPEELGLPAHLLRPPPAAQRPPGTAPFDDEPDTVGADRVPWGVNVAGYFRSELGIGEVARRLVDALDTAGTPCLPVHPSLHPPTRRGVDFGSVDAALAPFPVNVVCVNADGLPAFAREVPALLEGRRTIGVWWWELPVLPPEHHGAFRLVDEVWVGSRHVQRAIEEISPVPVLRLPMPVRVPVPPPRTRAELGLPAGPLVLSMFDFNSVVARKNPEGLVDAFALAFPEPGRATLVLKSINGHRHPEALQRLRLHAARHPDVEVVDRHLEVHERDAWLASCDVYASLHRAEGLGLSLAEALALGKPVVATDWSGNVDFMDDRGAWMVPFDLVAVGPGQAPYPADGVWAEPRVADAARMLREIVDDPEAAATRAAIGQERVLRELSIEATAAAMAARLEVVRPSVEDARSESVAARAARRSAAQVQRLRELAAVDPGALPPPPNPLRRLARRAAISAQRTVTEPRRAFDDELVDVLQRHLEEVDAQAGAATQAQGLELASALERLRALERRLGADGEAPRIVATQQGVRLEAAERGLTEVQAMVDELRTGARAVPWTAGEPFALFDDPVGGRVLGFRAGLGDGRPVDGADPAGGPTQERYRAFEDVFRGSAERVENLVRPYVPVLRDHAPVLDVGCGRGELLSVLREEGVAASGVDSDEGMARVARARGLEVVVADAAEHLEGLPPGSLGAVTAIHVVEHLPLSVLERLLAASARALRPDGVLVLETINPHAGYAMKTFWVDPTHQHPLFPEVVLVLCAIAGFGSAHVWHPRGVGDVDADRFAQDAYAIVASVGARA